jgi:glycosyltransferase involved in cell wall biosynthesis
MHDYKLVCASYLLYDGQQPCQACTGGAHYHCLQKKCVKDSCMKSLLNMVEMYLHHRILHIYDIVDIYISPSMFLKGMLKKMGAKQNTVVVPNFIDANEYKPVYSNKGYVLYFGRLSREKGLHALLRAVQGLNIEVHVVGSGPCEKELIDTAKRMRLSNVRFCGYLTGEPLHQEIANALCVVLPSEWYENNPRSMLESFAFGKPVIGADIGGIPELMGKGTHGFMFRPGDHERLRAHVQYCASHPTEIITMGRAARAYVEAHHNPDIYYKKLMKIYHSVVTA